MLEFDYVVVGAGTAGCVLAARLAEDPDVSVALLEAGGPYRRVLNVPLVGLWAWLKRPRRFCWDDWTVPQAALENRRVWWPAGRLVGGSSAINAMMYSRGAAASYDRWRSDSSSNEPEWSHRALLPYFCRAEDQERGESAFHGVGGPISVSDSRYISEAGRAFLAGCGEVGIAECDDFNGPQADGVGVLQLTQRLGRRSTAVEYLRATPGGQRVSLRLATPVVRVVIENDRAIGVHCATGRALQFVRARRGVILSAGVVRSPQLLMRSGIGPADALRRLGIDVVADSPGVGANLQDHVRIPVIRRWSGPRPTRPAALARAGIECLLRRRGLLASNVSDAVAIVGLQPSAEIPVIRIVCQWRALPETRGSFIDLEVVLIDPKSRGRLTFASPGSDMPPAIDPGYLSDSRDMSSLLHGIEIARAIASSEACRQAGMGEEVRPGDSDVAAHVRRFADSAYHAVGTCSLGSGPMAVVDTRLRVRGVDGLRVVDSSVMPTTVAGNAQAAVYAIAERAADLMRRS